MFLNIQRQEKAYNDLRKNWKNEKVLDSDELCKLVIAKYAQKGRFKGQYMSISEAGQNVLIKIIVARLNGINIDIVAKILSSNVCENYFSVLTKFSHGKRKNGDFTDTWRIQQYVVAGLISNENFLLELMEKVGSPINHIRQQKLESIIRAKRYQQGYHKTVEQKNRRRLATQIRQHALGKLENNKNRHVSDKIQPGETVDLAREKATATKKGKDQPNVETAVN